METDGKTGLKIATFFIIGVIVIFGFGALYINYLQPSLTPRLTLDQMYENAINDAMTAKENETYNGLTAIVETDLNLKWRGDPGNNSVLVVVWTRFVSSYPLAATVDTWWGDTWVTVVPEIKTFFKTHVDPESNLTLRVKQLLGLPPNNNNSYFVELWVKPQSLFRPSADNGINDTDAQLAFPGNTDPTYEKWFNDNIIYSYFPKRLPWTRLGYTYDWGNSNSHVGLSEFVIKQNSTVIVESVTPTAEYLYSND